MSRIIQEKINSSIKFIKETDRVEDNTPSTMSRDEILLADEISECYTNIVSKKHVQLVEVDDSDEVVVLENVSDVCIIDSEPSKINTASLEDVTVIPSDDVTLIEHNPKKVECLNLVDDDDIEEVFIKKNIPPISYHHKIKNLCKDYSKKKNPDSEKSDCEIVSENKNISVCNSKKKPRSYFDCNKNSTSLLGDPSAYYDYCHVCSSQFTKNSGHELSSYHQIKLREVILNNIDAVSKPPSKPRTAPSNSPSTSSNCSIPPSNIGFKMLVAAGWKKDTGLGKNGNGIKTPIITTVRNGRSGLGLSGIQSKQVKQYPSTKPIGFQLGGRMNSS